MRRREVARVDVDDLVEAYRHRTESLAAWCVRHGVSALAILRASWRDKRRGGQ